MKFIYYFLESKGGIFYEYLLLYGSYIKMQAKNSQKNNSLNINTGINSFNFNNKSSSMNQDLLNSFAYNNFNNINNLPEKNRILLNFPLTRNILKIYLYVFNLPEKFSFVVNEYTSLDFIRLHYISFIKLYNKNMDINSKLGDVNKLFENSNFNKQDIKRKIKRLIREIYNDDTYLKLIIELCKLHIKCLFNLAKNRNLDVGKKFLQLGIVDFLAKEIDLEHEAAEIIHRIKYQNEKKSKISEGNFTKKKDKVLFEENVIDKNEKNLNFNKNNLILETCEDIESENINSNNKLNANEDLSKSDSLNDSDYDDLSLDFIDPKYVNSNIKLNKALKLDHLVESVPIEKTNIKNNEKENYKEKEEKKIDVNSIKIKEKENFAVKNTESANFIKQEKSENGK